ncbi:MAG: glycosyltransferase family 1 protein, partial [Candidatus Eisenbacteria bacterium]|nr:glycosyltransferase family 1 protein [Candidatus Eisenbacteria bacterium]
VEPRDPAAMSEAVLRLALDPQRRAALGAAGHERWARSYTISGCVKATLETYEWARALPLR